MAFDFYPTPSKIASRVAAASSVRVPQRIADFSAGDGSLLRAASERWPNAQIIATDIQSGLVRQIREENPGWLVGRCDFLLDRSSMSCKPLMGQKGNIDVVLLNPPFSTRGQLDKTDTQGSSSIAIRFLQRAAAYTSPQGEICAILPISSLYGEKDESARRNIESEWEISVIEKLRRGSFPGCFAESAIVKLTRRGVGSDAYILRTPVPAADYGIFRGRVHVHMAKAKSRGSRVEFIHSTNLVNNLVTRSAMHVEPVDVISGPAVLIHRVGRPSASKICLLEPGRRVRLSDCVIALKASNAAEANSLIVRMKCRFDLVKSAYIGTGAPFITVARLRNLLPQLLSQESN